MKTKSKNNIIHIERLHEQREYLADKTFNIDHLRKGMWFEVLDWERKSENVVLHKRMELIDHHLTSNKTHDFLTLNMKVHDLEDDKKIRQDIIDRIIAKHGESLIYSTVNAMVRNIKRVEYTQGAMSIREVEKHLKTELDDSKHDKIDV